MIRRAVRKTFRTVSWIPPEIPVRQPAIFVANHHGWHDGYVMYLALSQLNLERFHDWIQEFEAFPLFGKIGGMPFPANDAGRRAQTVRETIRYLKRGHSMMLFAEGELHRPPALLPFGKSLELLHRHVSEASVVPVAIRYEMSTHERPEAYLRFGKPMTAGDGIASRTRLEVASLLDEIAVTLVTSPERFLTLHKGTLDVNERMDMRSIPGMGSKPGN